MKRIIALIAVVVFYATFSVGFTFAHNNGFIGKTLNDLTIEGEFSENIQNYKIGLDPGDPPPPFANIPNLDPGDPPPPFADIPNLDPGDPPPPFADIPNAGL